MSKKENTQKFFDKGHKALSEFTCAPLSYALGDYDEPRGRDRNDEVPDLVTRLLCAPLLCCSRSPCCCVGSAVTIPLGVAAMIAWGVLGYLSTGVAATADACLTLPPPRQQMRIPNIPRPLQGDAIIRANPPHPVSQEIEAPPPYDDAPPPPYSR